MFLREYLYIDIDKVRGILSQIEEGIPETAKQIARKESDAEARNRLIGGVGRKSIDEESIEKSLGDALFPLLEEQLEALSVLTDISEELQTHSGLTELHKQLAPGTLVRVTAPARLFHPEQLSHAMVGIGTSATGLQDMLNSLGQPEAGVQPPTKNRQQPGKARQKPKAKQAPDTVYPEDALFDLPEIIIDSIPRDFLIGMIRLIRGAFSEGVHVHFHPQGDTGPIITARLETGRRFLDSTPEVLFSRYGFRPQEWTVVGTIGHLAEPGSSAIDPNFLEKFDRSSMLQLAASILQEAGETGFIDLPAGLGFSVVPLAVYRAIGWTGDGPRDVGEHALPAIESSR